MIVLQVITTKLFVQTEGFIIKIKPSVGTNDAFTKIIIEIRSRGV